MQYKGDWGQRVCDSTDILELFLSRKLFTSKELKRNYNTTSLYKIAYDVTVVGFDLGLTLAPEGQKGRQNICYEFSPTMLLNSSLEHMIVYILPYM